MDKEIQNYVHKHMFIITFTVVLAFGLLAAGELYLYKRQMDLNKMVSEGLMQIKEELNRDSVMKVPAPSVIPVTSPAKMK